MKRVKLTVATVAACVTMVFCSACTTTIADRSVPPASFGYINATVASGPFAVTSSGSNLRTGVSEAIAILGLISYGDATSAAACKNGRVDIIKDVNVDILKVHLYGFPIFYRYTTVVTGK